MNVFIRSFAAASLIAAATPYAQAGVLGVGARVDGFDVTAIERAVPLKPDGSRTVTFRTTRANKIVVVTYNAECMATGPVGAWVSVRITVDNIEAAPQAGQGFALCSASDQSALLPVAASRQAVIRVPNAGVHTVRVLAALNNNARSGRLDDSSLMVKD